MSLETILLDGVLGLVIGLTLGLLGGGGSILTVPMLVYLVGQTPQAAVTASLMIVGANSALGVLFHRANGAVSWRTALLFGSVGMAFAYLAANFSKFFPAEALMIAFALLMLVVGALMLRKKSEPKADQVELSWRKVLIGGAGVGALTGFLGVGGGFLIVPALVMLVGLPMKQAVGTSLVVIAMNSAAGLLGHLGETPLDFGMIAVFVGAGLLGTFIGARLTRWLKPEQLRQAFAVFVIGLAAVLLMDNLSKLL
ncbi:MAG: sulfite exporter TauE/SafE family protein [Anaerolineae bacterium]|nr:sulfite exporter TauE/SafE family protein [Anaerolineae bacterium]MDW8298433.1 sulfite exporter TauE/SafE family protein [Anaerolineae bacterium]